MFLQALASSFSPVCPHPIHNDIPCSPMFTIQKHSSILKTVQIQRVGQSFLNSQSGT